MTAEKSDPLAAPLRDWLPFVLSAAITAGIAPLLFVQILYQRAFYTANLLLFNRKFFPSWERRFVVYERRRDLPRVGIAALAAEAYLPFSGRGRR